jgi:hypothetical protein
LAQDPFGKDKKWHEAKVEDVRQGVAVKAGQPAIVEEGTREEAGWRFWVKYKASGMSQWVGRKQVKGRGGSTFEEGPSVGGARASGGAKKQAGGAQAKPAPKKRKKGNTDWAGRIAVAMGADVPSPPGVLFTCDMAGCDFESASQAEVEAHEETCSFGLGSA